MSLGYLVMKNPYQCPMKTVMLSLVKSSAAVVATAATTGIHQIHHLHNNKHLVSCLLSSRYRTVLNLHRQKSTNLCKKMGSRLAKFRSDSYDVQGQQDSASIGTMNSNNDEIIEKVLCKVDDLEDQQMKEFTVESDKKILLIKDKGTFVAVGTKCTHYGAPLVNGVYCNGIVRCPWHGACFNSQTGDIEDFPGLDSLPSFEVQVENNEVKLCTKKSALENNKYEKKMVNRDPNDNTAFVMLGAGAAASKCAETLRQIGYKGRIVMITKEAHAPYDRPKLSKALDMAPDKIALRPSSFYGKHDIEVMNNTEITSISTKEKIVTFKDGSTIAYTKLLIATGGIPRLLTNVPGITLKNIVVLRSVDDANYLANNIKDKNVIILGASFIGMECAAYMVGKAASVTVIGATTVPFLPVLGEEIGTRLMELFREKGVTFRNSETITCFNGDDDGQLKEVVLEDETILPADICLLGIGVEPATKFLKDSEIALSPFGKVIVDKHLKTNVEDIYAAGDIVVFPLFCADNKEVNVQHWQMAHYHGHIAAMNMMDQDKAVHSVPFFWTMFFGLSLRYAGFGAGFEKVIIQGNLDKMECAAYYIKDNMAIAIASLKRDPIAAQFAEVLRAGKTITEEEVTSETWQKKLYD